MNEFGKKIGNTVLNLFIDPENNINQNTQDMGTGEYDCVKKDLSEEGLRVIINLTPKSHLLSRKYDILVLDIIHSRNKTDHNFTPFEHFQNDNPQNLTNNFSFLLKFIISACSLSPFLSFTKSTSVTGIELLRRKFILNYTVEYLTEHEMLKNYCITELQGTQLYNFNKKLEKVDESLTVELQVVDNVDALINMLREKESLLTKNTSQKLIRNRFLSEDSRDDFSEFSSFRKRSSRYQSAFNLKASFDNRSSFLQKNRKRPFKLMDEELLENNINEDSSEDGNYIAEPQLTDYNLELKQLNNSSSFFLSTNFSLKSKKTEKNEELNFDLFGTEPTINNLYYILNRTKICFNATLRQKGDNYSKSSRSNRQKASNTHSNNNLAKKVIINFN